ncbi:MULTISPECIES: uracil-DNA glycosylase family protein [Bacteroidales]|jgi:uracil-DNA glycosylase|uniref:Uracil-DNA glycosylase n=2 Tax=Bacteroidales TaxID=171549 RepID=A0A1C7H4E4_9BACE|nr:MULTISPECIES: uracil-DNA glycosylase family protein [Bacteroidales]ANU58856.1 uracil-DNA glycosylase [Bacteroides caecimuris]NBH90723.1 uracil-DNA glycosylase [Parabacteroides distasonis]OXE62750.1 uracil-DNA glycosylase [Bacteroides caecimuris]QQR16222.1 uracil-DNA glycosylase family protein [Bacteroides caecimuris]RLT71966.1 uracil-DNA glycosylase [Parabacteroides distasonis]
MNIKSELQQLCGDTQNLRLNDVNIEPETIQAIMINEVVPSCPEDDFYGKPDSAYMSTTIPMFRKAGIEIGSVQDILNNGIYITNAVKTPKTEYAVSKESIEDSLPYLEKELALFPNVKVIMLMGDVAKKAFNMICKKATKKNAVPSISTYKLRNTEIFYNGIRIMPSYIMTGQNILIEKSKFEMASKDIETMYRLIKCFD